MLVAASGLYFAIGIGDAFAHHGWTSYDSDTLLSLTGTIVEVDYRNPHVQIVLEVPAEPEEDGTIEDPPHHLLIVMAPPARSESRGMPREMVAVGNEATAEGYLHRTQDLELRAERVTIGGITVELR
jgi:hypothetical protein